MAKEKSLVFIKPGHIGLAEEIFEFLDKILGDDFEKLFSPLRIQALPLGLIKKHYSHRIDSPSYEATINALSKQGVVLTVYMGEDIINRIRQAVGNTDSSRAKSGTIRAKYGKHSLNWFLKHKAHVENAIHASGSQEEAENEIKMWRKHLRKDYKVLDLTK